jgi:hypothetical protein
LCFVYFAGLMRLAKARRGARNSAAVMWRKMYHAVGGMAIAMPLVIRATSSVK